MSIPEGLARALLMTAEVCPACRGTQLGPWDSNEGRCMPCGHCDGSGRVVTCLECGHDVAAPEAEEMGHYCAGCRVALDRPEAAE